MDVDPDLVWTIIQDELPALVRSPAMSSAAHKAPGKSNPRSGAPVQWVR